MDLLVLGAVYKERGRSKANDPSAICFLFSVYMQLVPSGRIFLLIRIFLAERCERDPYTMNMAFAGKIIVLRTKQTKMAAVRSGESQLISPILLLTTRIEISACKQSEKLFRVLGSCCC